MDITLEAPEELDESVNTDAETADAPDASQVSAELKTAMDEYEAFFDECIAFMKAYQADSSSADLLAQYPDMMTQDADTMAAMNEIDSESLSTADYAYYAEVSARIMGKLAEVA